MNKPEKKYYTNTRGVWKLAFDTAVRTMTISEAQDIYTVAWTDYSATSTITGWVSKTARIWYKKLGKLVFCQFEISGTSNNTPTSFTLPYSVNTSMGGTPSVFVLTMNNGEALSGGRLTVPASGSSFTISPDFAGSAWTASGTKSVFGEFWYEAA